MNRSRIAYRSYTGVYVLFIVVGAYLGALGYLTATGLEWQSAVNAPALKIVGIFVGVVIGGVVGVLLSIPAWLLLARLLFRLTRTEAEQALTTPTHRKLDVLTVWQLDAMYGRAKH